ncbi:MAG: hypothetical protein JWM25_1150 [Thermoleophilia bacterium]|nr:hypothetical protein [Thermoleophilia bacterium]MCZ4496567.1 hypothetical protein [Thermoleophilia bacterium]
MFPHRYAAGVRQLVAALDVEVIELPHTRASPEFLERHPELRARDLHGALEDPNIHGIVSTIGGDESIRLLPFLDLELIAANPKPFIGFSDTTVTHMAFLAAGVGSFYGPSLLAGFAENAGIDPYALDGARRALMGEEAPGVWPPNEDGWTVEFLDWADPSNQERPRARTDSDGWRWLQGGEAVVEGRCIAGCLEVLDWLRGTAVMPDLDGAVLAIETSEEAPSPEHVVRMLRALAAGSDGFGGLRALLFGRPGGADLDPATHVDYDIALLRVLREELGLTDLPIVTGMDFGHTDPSWTLPIGARLVVDCAAREVRFPDRVTS